MNNGSVPIGSPGRRTAVDSLASLLGNLGDPLRDKLATVFYQDMILTPDMLLAMYRTSWLSRKIVNIPAFDAARRWRNWQAEAADITLIEAEEKRLNLQRKILEAQVKARLFGGAGVFIGTGETDLMRPFEPERLGKGGIKYLTVASRLEYRAGEMDWNATSEFYGKPAYYRVSADPMAGTDVPVHPSRFVIFNGADNPEPRLNWADMGWGSSVLTYMFEAIKQMDSTAANMASLVFEANVDVFGIPDLLSKLVDPEYERRVALRFGLSASQKAINKALVIDKDEEYSRKEVTFAGLPDVFDRFLQNVCGAADIPATRLFGMSPAGLSSTGESDLRNYYDVVQSVQKLDITPAMYRLDEALIRSGMGTRPADIFYEWASLWQLTDKERADIGKITAETASSLFNTMLIPSEALAKSLVNALTESQVFPGLESEVEALPPLDWESKDNPPEPEPIDPTKIGDTRPMSLYISRRVVNSAEIIRWAKAQGFTTTLPGLDLHVTIAFSRAPVDWMKVGESYTSEMKIAAGGPRVVERYGEAAVLCFASWELTWRHQRVLDVGGSWDHPEYQPHITITWAIPEGLDMNAVEPYTGEIVLGPEIFREVNENWREGITEK